MSLKRFDSSAIHIAGHDRVGRAFDNLGRQQPERLNWLSCFAAVPWIMEFFDREVPGAAMSLDVDAEGRTIVIVACPCGKEPQVQPNHCIECEGEDCGRFYLATNSRVKVANSPNSPYRTDPKEQEKESWSGIGHDE